MLRKDLKREFKPTGASADPREIARFNALAEEWWKVEGAFKVVHAFNRARLGYLERELPILFQRDPRAAKPLHELQIIDVGCGAGIVTEALSSLGGTVIGIDAAERNIAVARRHAQDSGASIDYRLALPEELGEWAGRFDVALTLEVVEHVADPTAFVTAVGHLVKPGGILVVGTINRTLRSFVKAIVGAEYVLGWLPKGTHDWRKFIKPRELDMSVSALGFGVEVSTGVSFDILRRR